MPVCSSFSCDLEPFSPRESGQGSQLANCPARRQVLSCGHGHDQAHLYL